MSKGSILVVDDESEIREGLELLLKSEGYQVSSAESGQAGLSRLEERPFDLLLLDVSLPDRNGIDMLHEIHRQDPHLPVVLITAYGSIDMARAAFKSGAMDYITKPWSNDELLVQVAQAVEGAPAARRKCPAEARAETALQFPQYRWQERKNAGACLIWSRRWRPSRSTVLISGESGTGKELIAKAIHSASPRVDKPFVPVNTGSIPVDLLESQLFGHVKGAFTSAVASKKGLFEVADQGTIFFDEIATVSPETQAKLLRVIQEREFMRLGGTETDQSGCPHCRGLQRRFALPGQGRPLPRRPVSPPERHPSPLATPARPAGGYPPSPGHFMGRFCQENTKPLRQFTPAAMKLLMDYDWPGNVRELENVVERAVVLSTQERVDVDLLPETFRSKEIVRGVRLQLSEFLRRCRANPAREPRLTIPAPSLFQIMDEVERRIIVDMLERTGWNQTEAAERFQIPLSTLNQKIKRLGIDVRRRGRTDESAVRPLGK